VKNNLFSRSFSAFLGLSHLSYTVRRQEISQGRKIGNITKYPRNGDPGCEG
jgi:hypothetical protein